MREQPSPRTGSAGTDSMPRKRPARGDVVRADAWVWRGGMPRLFLGWFSPPFSGADVLSKGPAGGSLPSAGAPDPRPGGRLKAGNLKLERVPPEIKTSSGFNFTSRQTLFISGTLRRPAGLFPFSTFKRSI